jgi:hypothetical protein
MPLYIQYHLGDLPDVPWTRREDAAEPERHRTHLGPRLALARAVRSGLLPRAALGESADVALEDLDRVERWRESILD